MKPSSLRTRAISTFILLPGMLTVRWLAALALRMRVSMSAMVSLIMISPRALLDPGDLAQAGQPAEADAAHAEAAHVRPRTAAEAAAVVLLAAEPGRAQRLGDQGFLGHGLPLHAVSGALRRARGFSISVVVITAVQACGRACRTGSAGRAPRRRCGRWRRCRPPTRAACRS